MTNEPAATERRTPWHLWAVGGLGLLWNGYGCYDYFMTNTQGEAFMRGAGMSEAQIAYMNAMPVWTTGTWALGVWGSLLGSLLLLRRSRWAFHVFAASAAGLAGTLTYTYLLSNGAETLGMQGTVMYAVIAAIILFQVWYARLMTKRGVLR